MQTKTKTKRTYKDSSPYCFHNLYHYSIFVVFWTTQIHKNMQKATALCVFCYENIHGSFKHIPFVVLCQKLSTVWFPIYRLLVLWLYYFDRHSKQFSFCYIKLMATHPSVHGGNQSWYSNNIWHHRARQYRLSPARLPSSTIARWNPYKCHMSILVQLLVQCYSSSYLFALRLRVEADKCGTYV